MKDKFIGLLCTFDVWVNWQDWLEGDGKMRSRSDEDQHIYRVLSYALIVAVLLTGFMVSILSYGPLVVNTMYLIRR